MTAKKKSPQSKSFTADERAAMKERSTELKGEGDGEAVVLAKIAAMAEPDRAMAKRVHEIVMKAAPDLVPRLWYGMPAYSLNDKTICWFQDAKKFKSRYATLGFSDKATLDDGTMWPVAFALSKLSAADESRISALVKQAVKG